MPVDDATVFGMVSNTVYLYDDSSTASIWSHPRPMEVQNAYTNIVNVYMDTMDFAVDDGRWSTEYRVSIKDPNVPYYEGSYLLPTHTLYKLYDKINQLNKANYSLEQAAIMQKLLRKRVSSTFDPETGNGSVTVVNPTYELVKQLVDDYDATIKSTDTSISGMLRTTGLYDLTKDEVSLFKFSIGYDNNVATITSERDMESVASLATANVGILMLQFPIGDVQINVMDKEGKTLGWLQYFQIPGIASQTPVRQLNTTIYYGEQVTANGTKANIGNGALKVEGDALFPIMGFNRWFFDRDDELKESKTSLWYRSPEFSIVQGRSVNVLHTKVPGDIDYIGDDSNINNHPSIGTLINFTCDNNDKIGIYADGKGGTYRSVLQANSPDCIESGGGTGGGSGGATGTDPDPIIPDPVIYDPVVALRYLNMSFTIEGATELTTSTNAQASSDRFRIKVVANGIQNPNNSDIVATTRIEIRGDEDNRDIEKKTIGLYNGTIVDRNISIGYGKENQSGRHVVTFIAEVNGTIYRSTPVVINWEKVIDDPVPDELDLSNFKLSFTIDGKTNITRSTKDFNDVNYRLVASGIVNTINDPLENKIWMEIRGPKDNQNVFKDQFLSVPLKNGVVIDEVRDLPYTVDEQTGAHTVRYAMLLNGETYYSNAVTVNWNAMASVTCARSYEEKISLGLSKTTLQVDKTTPIEPTDLIINLENFSCCSCHIWLESEFVSCTESRYKDSPIYHGTIKQDVRMDDVFYVQKNTNLGTRTTPREDRIFKFDKNGVLASSSIADINPDYITRVNTGVYRINYSGLQLDLLGGEFPDICNIQKEISIVFNLKVKALLVDTNKEVSSNVVQVTYKIQPDENDNPYWYDCEFSLHNVNKYRACLAYYVES